MKMEEKENFKYLDFSNNLFTKITLVNTLDLKEIELLNEKYHELGLFIKQVRVDQFGNEKSPNELLYEDYDDSESNLLKRKRKSRRHSKLNIQEFVNKYENYDLSFKEKEKPKKKLVKNKYKGNNNNNINNKRDDNSDNQSEDEFEEEVENVYESIKSLKDNLIGLEQECQSIQYKNCKIEDENFKKKIIEYIKKFSSYISDSEYERLFNKWKDENMKIKGMNLFECNDLYKWKVPILKAFKSEITLKATIKILGSQIDGGAEEKSDDDNKRDEEEKEEDKKEDENKKVVDDDDSSSSNNDDNDFLANQPQINQLNRNARVLDEE